MVYPIDKIFGNCLHNIFRRVRAQFIFFIFRFWANANPHFVYEKNQREPKSLQVMVWAGIIQNHVIGPYFFEENVNSESYLNMLGNFVIPELHALNIDPQQIWFQQDGASAHYAKDVRHFCDENFHAWIGRGGFINWPARSPDHNPMDVFFWSYIKEKVYKPRPASLNELKQRIGEAMNNVPGETIANVRGNLLRRLLKCIELNGDHVTNQGV